MKKETIMDESIFMLYYVFSFLMMTALLAPKRSFSSRNHLYQKLVSIVLMMTVSTSSSKMKKNLGRMSCALPRVPNSFDESCKLDYKLGGVHVFVKM